MADGFIDGQERLPRGRGRGRVCFKCGEDGHFSRDCPNGGGLRCCHSTNLRKWSSRMCFKCGDVHTSKACVIKDQPLDRYGTRVNRSKLNITPFSAASEPVVPASRLAVLRRSLECPVCFELSSGEIINCQTGHSFCKECSRQLVNCALCKKPITSSRNFALEAAIADFNNALAPAAEASSRTAGPSSTAKPKEVRRLGSNYWSDDEDW